MHIIKGKGESSLAPDVEALSRQGASLRRHAESLGKRVSEHVKKKSVDEPKNFEQDFSDRLKNFTKTV